MAQLVNNPPAMWETWVQTLGWEDPLEKGKATHSRILTYPFQKQQVELDMEQWTGSKSGKQYFKAVYCHPVYLTHMKSTSWETLGWLDEVQAGIKIAGRNINNLRYADDTTLMAESEEEIKSLLMKVKEQSEKAGLKVNIQKTTIMASGPITSWQIDGETVETVTLYFLVLQNHCTLLCQQRSI